MRLFIAIAPEGDAATAVEQVQKRLASQSETLRWTRPEDHHVTLQFLGEVPEEQAVRVREALAGVRAEQVRVRINSLGFFPRAGVFWAGVELTGELLALQQRVTASTRACGFVAEPRPYRPHITLARSRGRHGSGALAALEEAVRRGKIRIAGECVVREFGLYESCPGTEGPRYEVRARFRLGFD